MWVACNSLQCVGTAGTHCFFLYLFMCLRPGSRALIRCGMWEFDQPIPPVKRWQHTHTWNEKGVLFSIVLLVTCLNYSSKALWYYWPDLIPWSVASSVLFFNTFVFLQERRTAVKVGTVPCLRECWRKGEREEEELAKETQVSCFIHRRKENDINKLLLKPFELYFAVGYYVYA